MSQMLERGDTNKDGALDKGELKKVFESFRNRGQRPEGARRPGQGGGDRPQRPERGKKSREDQPRRKSAEKEKETEA